MAKRCVLVAFAVAGAALAAPSQLSQEPRAGWLHKAYVWLCSRHPQHRWCQHSGQQDKEALPSQQEEDILQEKDVPLPPVPLPKPTLETKRGPLFASNPDAPTGTFISLNFVKNFQGTPYLVGRRHSLSGRRHCSIPLESAFVAYLRALNITTSVQLKIANEQHFTCSSL